MVFFRLLFLAACFSYILSQGVIANDAVPAKQLFGSRTIPADLKARSIGSYAKGCLAGGVALSVDGPYWQAMRLSRNRNWGHPTLIAYLEKLSEEVATKDGWNGLLVGDLAQPRGGPMLTGHASHQIGLDADVWLRPMPEQRFTTQQREEISAISVLKSGTRTIDPKVWTDAHFRILKRAASFDEVARIFVHPAIKQKLCENEAGNSSWLRKIRPWYGHHYHFHVRLKCPPDSDRCINQALPPLGSGCGKALEWWLSEEPWKPKPEPKNPNAKPRFRRLSELPKGCTAVLDAPGPGGIAVQALTKAWPPVPWEKAPLPAPRP